MEVLRVSIVPGTLSSAVSPVYKRSADGGSHRNDVMKEGGIQKSDDEVCPLPVNFSGREERKGEK